jgi:hypothetical protein
MAIGVVVVPLPLGVSLSLLLYPEGYKESN